jgi:hypothetical protein
MTDRYSRQRRLAQVGDAGQARLEDARFDVTAGPSALVEVAYLARAGARAVLVDRFLPRAPFAHAAHFRHAASRRLAAGSWRALQKLTATLRLP